MANETFGLPSETSQFIMEEELQKLNADISILQSKIEQYYEDSQDCMNYILYNLQNSLANDVIALIRKYEELHKKMTDELNCLQSHRAFDFNGQLRENNLNGVQNNVCILYDMAYSIQLLIAKIPNESYVKEFQNVNMPQLQFKLLMASLIVTQQPPFVLKTQHKFSAEVCWLLGPKLFPQISSRVDCTILSDDQIKTHYPERPITEVYNGTPIHLNEIECNASDMMYDSAQNCYTAHFVNMSIKQRINRSNRDEGRAVTEKTFALVFQLICDNFTLHSVSLPFVVTVHNNQDSKAWSTILWNFALSEMYLDPLLDPKVREVPWHALARVLSLKFKAETKRELSNTDLVFLYEKLCNCNYITNGYITLANFSQSSLLNYQHTFWDWLYACMKLIKESFPYLWQAGYIAGFISKAASNEIIQASGYGTFLLRFSDSVRGAISLVYAQSGCIQHLDPWTACDLKSPTLADRLRDVDGLDNVYPTFEEKNKAFGPFYSQVPNPRDGYFRTRLRLEIVN